MEDGIKNKTTEGTLQGGVISPLFANLVGDIIDKELTTDVPPYEVG